MIGIIPARYLIDDFYETITVIVPDSLEAVDAERITTLVESVDVYTDYPSYSYASGALTGGARYC